MENDQITITKTKVKTIQPKNNPNKKEEEKTESVSKNIFKKAKKRY